MPRSLAEFFELFSGRAWVMLVVLAGLLGLWLFTGGKTDPGIVVHLDHKPSRGQAAASVVISFDVPTRIEALWVVALSDAESEPSFMDPDDDDRTDPNLMWLLDVPEDASEDAREPRPERVFGYGLAPQGLASGIPGIDNARPLKPGDWYLLSMQTDRGEVSQRFQALPNRAG